MRRLARLHTHIDQALDRAGIAPTELASREALLRPIRGYLSWLHNAPPLTRALETDLVRNIREGDRQAESQLVLYGSSIAIRAAFAYIGHGLPLADLVHEAMVGVVYAVRRYQPQKTRFLSYAFFWIRLAVCRALAAQYGSGRFSTLCEQVRHVSVIRAGLVDEPTTISEISAATRLREDAVAHILRITQPAVSLDDVTTPGDENPTTLGDEDPTAAGDGDPFAERVQIPDETVSVFSRLAREDVQAYVSLIVGLLPEHEQHVIRLLFGLGGRDAMSPSEFARTTGIPVSRVRLRAHRALQRLRRYVISRYVIASSWTPDAVREDLALMEADV